MNIPDVWWSDHSCLSFRLLPGHYLTDLFWHLILTQWKWWRRFEKRLTKFEWTEHYSKTFLVIISCSLFFLVWIRNLFFYEREEWNNFPFHDYVPIIITKIDNDNILILPFWPHIMLCLITFGSASCPCFR